MDPRFDELAHRIDEASPPDQPALRLELRKLRRRAEQGKPFDRILDRLEAQLQGAAPPSPEPAPRRASRPNPRFPQDLPVVARRQDIARAIGEHQVVIVCGDTGSGKSTQLPKICLDIGRGETGLIGHTQPRRIAARALASRLADELGTSVGKAVGYKVRFSDVTGDETFVKLMTDGILLAETQRDRDLLQYDTLIIDEAHERSLNIDFLLGYLKRLLPRRRDLKLIITSATIDPQRFAEHFAGRDGKPAPIVEVSGRTYPVEVRYRPMEQPEQGDVDLPAAVREALDELQGQGDVLVFLPTERDILETARSLRDQEQRGVEVLPLYARLSPKEQQRVFEPSGRRRIVLATNVAETSLTVPGVRCVIDSGLARLSRYSARAGVQRLPIERVSQASADQRKGRCGRVAPGICIRLYSEEDYENRERYTSPEVTRSNLAQVILQMRALRLGEVEQFPFIDPPRHAAVRDGYATLHELGAVDDRHELTPVGRRMAKLPLDPRIARMLLAADDAGCVSEVLPITAALSAGDPRVRPQESPEAADEAHAKLADPRSDFLTLLKLWDFVHDHARRLKRTQFHKLCQQHFLSPTRVREWMDVDRQLRELAGEAGFSLAARRVSFADEVEDKSSVDNVHRALLAGLVTNVAFRQEPVVYTGTGGKKLYLWPGSVLFEARPLWIMAAEHVETTRLYARTVGPIDPRWIEKLAPHLLSHSFSEPHYNVRSGHVQAWEKVSLGGLVVIPRRRVHYGRIDPTVSRELFIRHALVLGEYDRRALFMEHNRQLIRRVETFEAKLRRRDLLADEERRFAFYDQRLPASVNNLPAFEQWRKRAERDNPRLLFMSESDLLTQPVEVVDHAYPDQWHDESLQLPLEYRLEPGEPHDGVTLVVPVEAVNQLESARLGWIVPGLLEEKVVAMIRSLPKNLRRNFVPAPNCAAEVLSHLDERQGPLDEALAAALSRASGVSVCAADFDVQQLPAHLRLNIRVIDDEGQTLAESRSLADIRSAVGDQASVSLQTVDESRYHRDGLTRWDFGTIEEHVEVCRRGVTLKAFPALVDQGGAAGLRLLDALETAQLAHHAGVRRLLALALADPVQHQVMQLPGLERMVLQASTFMTKQQLRQQLTDLIVDRACLDDPAWSVRDPLAFADRLDHGWGRLSEIAVPTGRLLALILDQYQQAALALEKAEAAKTWPVATGDVRTQVAGLLHPRTLSDTPWTWLSQFPRYLQAIRARLQKVSQGRYDRDQQALRELAPWLQRYHDRAADHAQRRLIDPQLSHFRWMLEEYRVSLFAQELGTAISVSPKRLEKQWATVRT